MDISSTDTMGLVQTKLDLMFSVVKFLVAMTVEITLSSLRKNSITDFIRFCLRNFSCALLDCNMWLVIYHLLEDTVRRNLRHKTSI